jgi:L-alanine-DL-glutamate epimerase-like enolase superfamily enzyme
MLSVRTASFPLRITTAWGTLTTREYLEVRLDFPDGTHGLGEAAPLEPYDGVSLAATRAALDAYGQIREPPETLLEACRQERDLPQALAAIDLALWDRAARGAQTPLARLIDPDAHHDVLVNATIGAEDRAGAARQAARALEQGFTCVKVKVGIGDDAGRVAAVRALSPDLLIRVDANGAWQTPREALANLRVLAPMRIELCEEPIHGIDALSEVCKESEIPIAGDETFAPGAADAVCLKITRGGITQVLRDAATARAAGTDVYLASTFDGPRGLAAGLHAAAGLKVIRHSGLATGDQVVRKGRISLPILT